MPLSCQRLLELAGQEWNHARKSFWHRRAQPPTPGPERVYQAPEKQYSGDLVGTGTGTGTGTMLTAMPPRQGPTGDVAIERTTGSLGGRTGGFMLQRTFTLGRSAKQLRIAVVPDSGTEQLTRLTGLARLTGQLAINTVEGKHFYALDDSLPDWKP